MSEIKNSLKRENSQCKHFVIRKKRFCRMTVKSGLEYCGEHQPKSSETGDLTDTRIRIPCPLDKKHTCFAHKLAKHLQKCNAKIDTSIPYILHGVNAGDKIEFSINRQLSDVPVNHILAVIKKVNTLYEDVIQQLITTKILSHEQLTEELNKAEYGETTRKHLLQTSSLLGHIKEANLLQEKTCFVEFGAGKGQLSYWISKASNSLSGTSVLLVERASLRHKLDNKLDKNESSVHRIRADIADLVLNKVDIVIKSEKIVGVTKHLCGDATDLALRCLINNSNQNLNIAGLVMAFCCHHRCHWSAYTGKSFFEKNNLSREDFDVICGLVSWATCGSGKSRNKRQNAAILPQEEEEEQIKIVNSRDAEIGLTREEKEKVGKKCKLVIDYGRLQYLEENDFNCNLYYYVDQQVSLENVCIVACKCA